MSAVLNADDGTASRRVKDDGAPTATDYRRILVEARKRQLAVTRENIQRLEQTFDAVAADIVERVKNLPDEGTARRDYYLNLLRAVDRLLLNLRSDFGNLVQIGMVESAQAAAAREADVAAMVGAKADPSLFPDIERTQVLSNGTEIRLQFGRVAVRAVDAVTRRVYRDGLSLSNRLYRLDKATRQVVENTLVSGVAQGQSAQDLAKRLRAALSASGVETPRYRAMRLARTEINNAHREGHLLSVLDPHGGGLKDYIAGVRWNLSLSHKEPDICDLWAGHDAGLGAGVYLPSEVPVDHPNGLCYLTTELKALPGVVGPGKKPNVADVPQSQIDYYAGLGDPAARTRQSDAT